MRAWVVEEGPEERGVDVAPEELCLALPWVVDARADRACGVVDVDANIAPLEADDARVFIVENLPVAFISRRTPDGVEGEHGQGGTRRRVVSSGERGLL